MSEQKNNKLEKKEVVGNLDMSYTKTDYTEELANISTRINSAVKKGYQAPDLRLEDNPMLQQRFADTHI